MSRESSGFRRGECQDLLHKAQPDRSYLLMAPTYPMLRWSFKAAIEIAAQCSLLGTYSKAGCCLTLANGANILFHSDVDRGVSVHGLALSGVAMDEASLISRDGAISVAASLREDGAPGWVTCGFTPLLTNHWTYEMVAQKLVRNVDMEPPVRRHADVFYASSTDNPYLPSNFEENLRRCYAGCAANEHELALRTQLEGRFV